jgi:hypothetical protein
MGQNFRDWLGMGPGFICHLDYIITINLGVLDNILKMALKPSCSATGFVFAKPIHGHILFGNKTRLHCNREILKLGPPK